MTFKNHLSNPVVSVCCTTYNHASYIKKAIDSFLMQKTNFPFEIIIRDDASTDDTAQIISQYQKKYPNIIKPIFEQHNMYKKGVKAFPIVFQQAQGQYLALCEGDDYWNDPYKLQKQIDFLEQHPEYSMSFHNSNRLDETTNTYIDDYPNIEQDRDFSLLDFITSNYASTTTIVRRNQPFNYPPNFHKIKFADWPLNLIFASKGKIRYHAQAMATYRIHRGGVWSGNTEIKKNRYTIYMLEEMNKYFSYKYHKEFSKVILKQIYQQIKNYLLLGQKKKARWMVQYAFKNYKLGSLKKLKFFLKLCPLKKNK
ncbi:MAG: glycosyltransferase [Arcobacteraceae bacterium]|jgi:glycosyltransferase involved in cell wall biosynthesis